MKNRMIFLELEARAIEEGRPPIRLAVGLAELSGLPLAEAIRQTEGLRSVALKLQSDRRGLEEFRWRLLPFIGGSDRMKAIVTHPRTICEKLFPFLVPYTVVMMEDLYHFIEAGKIADRNKEPFTIDGFVTDLCNQKRYP
jgi:hypothetical protein